MSKLYSIISKEIRTIETKDGSLSSFIYVVVDFETPEWRPIADKCVNEIFKEIEPSAYLHHVPRPSNVLLVYEGLPILAQPLLYLPSGAEVTDGFIVYHGVPISPEIAGDVAGDDILRKKIFEDFCYGRKKHYIPQSLYDFRPEFFDEQIELVRSKGLLEHVTDVIAPETAGPVSFS